MKIKDLVDAPQWLKDAIVENEDVDIIDGIVIWRNGIWCNGTWRNGTWCNGIWCNGTWRNGTWRNGTWCNGEWCNGTWCNGIWRNGTWCNGTWCNGIWRDKNISDRLLFMASKIGIVFNSRGIATAYRTTQKDGHGRYIENFVQRSGRYYEADLPISGSGTCVQGVHVSSMATAITYFGVDVTAQLWEVKFKREDLLDCDGEKARIRGGVFKKIDCPFMKRKDK